MCLNRKQTGISKSQSLLLLCSLAGAYAAPQYNGGGGNGGNDGDNGGNYQGSPSNTAYYSGAPGPAATGGPGGSQPGKLPVYYDIPNAGWLGEVNVGGQPLKLLMDTGSADFWVLSDRLPRNAQQSASGGIYKVPNNVQVLQGGSWTIKYADGSGAEGDLVVFDTVTTDSGMSIVGQAIECATRTNGQPGDSSQGGEGTVGLIGMAFATDNTVTVGGSQNPQNTLWEQAGFGFFTTNLGPPSNKDIWFGIGYDDPTARNGQQLQYQPLDASQGYMGVKGCQTTVVGGQTIQNKYQNAILDTGTTLTFMDKQTVQQIYQALPGGQQSQSGDFVYDCDSQLPSISVSIGSAMLELDMSAFSNGEVTKGVCAGSIQPSPPGGGDNMYIYGTQIFRSAYFSFEKDASGNTQVGWVPYASSGSSSGGGNGGGGSQGGYPNSNGGSQGGYPNGSDGSQGGYPNGNGSGGSQGGYPNGNGSGGSQGGYSNGPSGGGANGYPYSGNGGGSGYPNGGNGGYPYGHGNGNGYDDGSNYKQTSKPDCDKAAPSRAQIDSSFAASYSKVADMLSGLKAEDIKINRGRVPRFPKSETNAAAKKASRKARL